MMYKAKAAVCSDIRTKHSTQSERQVGFVNVKPWWYVKKPLGVKRFNIDAYSHKQPRLCFNIRTLC